MTFDSHTLNRLPVRAKADTRITKAVDSCVKAPGTEIPAIKVEAFKSASAIWRENLTPGLPYVDYEQYRYGPIRDVAISSATEPLVASQMTSAEVTTAAEEMTTAAFICTIAAISERAAPRRPRRNRSF